MNRQQSFENFWLAPFESLKFVEDSRTWTTQDFIGEIREWPRLPIVIDEAGQHEYLRKLKEFYRLLFVWLQYSLVEMDALQREQLHIEAHFTDCITVKPDADFSLAIRALCYQVYGRSELLSQAPSFEHLWFLAEYSNCLQRVKHSGLLTGVPTSRRPGKALSKRDVLSDNANSIKIYKQAFTDGLLETEEISAHKDWRENFLNILIAESTKTAIDNRDRSLKKHCRQFLNAFSDYNRATEASDYNLWLLVNGQLIESVPGKKSVTLPSKKGKRTKGRPIGSQNRKQL